MRLFSSFRPEVEALAESSTPMVEKVQRYSEKFGFTFFPAQFREMCKLVTKDAALVTAEVGSGKTLLASVFLGLRTRRSSTVVIVAPKGVHPQWQEELSRFSGRRAISVDGPDSLAAGINLINIESFRSGASFNRPVDCVVADEAAFLSNGSIQAQSFLVATYGVLLRVALTATPIPNRFIELFSVLGWLSHPKWMDKDHTTPAFPYTPDQIIPFSNDHCFGFGGAVGITSPERAKELLAPFLINLTKNECRSDLPPLKLRFVPCSTPESVYASWEKCFKPSVPSNTETDFLNATPRVFGKTAMAWEKISHAIRQGKQVLIVSVRTEPLRALQLLLEASAVKVSTIYSEASTDYAQSAEDFRTGKSRVMLMGMKCAQGYNFPNCHRVIIIGSDFTFQMFYQTLGRCHRLTSELPVSVEVLYYTGTNEAHKLNTVIAKAVQSAVVLGERDYHLVGEISNTVRTVPDSWPLAKLAKPIQAPIGAEKVLTE